MNFTNYCKPRPDKFWVSNIHMTCILKPAIPTCSKNYRAVCSTKIFYNSSSRSVLIENFLKAVKSAPSIYNLQTKIHLEVGLGARFGSVRKIASNFGPKKTRTARFNKNEALKITRTSAWFEKSNPI